MDFIIIVGVANCPLCWAIYIYYTVAQAQPGPDEVDILQSSGVSALPNFQNCLQVGFLVISYSLFNLLH